MIEICYTLSLVKIGQMFPIFAHTSLCSILLHSPQYVHMEQWTEYASNLTSGGMGKCWKYVHDFSKLSQILGLDKL
jgi:hypothetical protein